MTEIIRVEKLDVGYNEEVVLSQLNFTINKGDITVILGKSGNSFGILINKKAGT